MGQEAARRLRLDLAGGGATGHEGRVDPVEHHRPVDDALAHVGAAREVVHHVEEHLFEDGPQPPGAGPAQQRLLGHRLEGVLGELQLHAIELEDPLVLPGQGVLRLHQDPDQGVLDRAATRAHDREAADELGDEAELHEVLGQAVISTTGTILTIFARLTRSTFLLLTAEILQDI